MISRRWFLVGLGLCLAVMTGGPGARAGALTGVKAPDKFVQTLGDAAIASLTAKDLSAEVRAQRFKDLLEEGFDVPAIGQFVLGRFWREASPAQRQEYLALFEKLLINTYAQRFQQYSGQRIQVGQVSQDAPGYANVASQVVQPDGPSVVVAWRLHQRSDGSLKVIDIVIEGVSMAITQRSEFASVIQSSGGTVDGLIAALRKKTSG